MKKRQSPIYGHVMTRQAYSRAVRNSQVRSGYKDSSFKWSPGEQQALIEKALAENRITKCDSADVTNKPVFGFEDSNFEGGKI